MATFDPVFRTLLLRVRDCERSHVDWPREVEKVLANYPEHRRSSLGVVLTTVLATLKEIEKNSNGGVDLNAGPPIT